MAFASSMKMRTFFPSALGFKKELVEDLQEFDLPLDFTLLASDLSNDLPE